MKVEKDTPKIAYKVFNHDWTCRGFKYEVGKSYHHTGSIYLCRSGFHACPKLVDCFEYYTFDHDNKVAIVRLWGTVEGDGNKLVANNIHIESELSWSDVLNTINEGNANTGMSNKGVRNAGFRNTGSYNTGSCNVGHFNAGDNNTGDRNTGQYNIGDRNIGDNNVGSDNSGNDNTGNYNSGNYNVGNHNSGSFNIGDHHIGWFNTESHGLCWFNKPVDPNAVSVVRIPYFLRNMSLTLWKPWHIMSDEERVLFPEAERRGGHLKSRTFKEAIRHSFRAFKEYSYTELRRDELSALKALPNFDPDIFYEITGIKESELN